MSGDDTRPPESGVMWFSIVILCYSIAKTTVICAKTGIAMAKKGVRRDTGTNSGDQAWRAW